MENPFDESSVRLTLRNGIEKGYWTLEQLDRPSGGWSLAEREWRSHVLNMKNTHRAHRNLLRGELDMDMF